MYPYDHVSFLRSLQYRMNLHEEMRSQHEQAHQDIKPRNTRGRGSSSNDKSSSRRGAANASATDGNKERVHRTQAIERPQWNSEYRRALVRLAHGTEVDITTPNASSSKKAMPEKKERHTCNSSRVSSSQQQRGDKSRHRQRRDRADARGPDTRDSTNESVPPTENKNDATSVKESDVAGRTYTMFPFKNHAALESVLARYRSRNDDYSDSESSTSDRDADKGKPTHSDPLVSHLIMHCCGHCTTCTDCRTGTTSHPAAAVPAPPPPAAVPAPPPLAAVPAPPPPAAVPAPPSTDAVSASRSPVLMCFGGTATRAPPVLSSAKRMKSVSPGQGDNGNVAINGTTASTTNNDVNRAGTDDAAVSNAEWDRNKLLVDAASRYVKGLEVEVDERARHFDVAVQQIAEEEARSCGLRRDRDTLLELNAQLERDNAELQSAIELAMKRRKEQHVGKSTRVPSRRSSSRRPTHRRHTVQPCEILHSSRSTSSSSSAGSSDSRDTTSTTSSSSDTSETCSTCTHRDAQRGGARRTHACATQTQSPDRAAECQFPVAVRAVYEQLRQGKDVQHAPEAGSPCASQTAHCVGSAQSNNDSIHTATAGHTVMHLPLTQHDHILTPASSIANATPSIPGGNSEITWNNALTANSTTATIRANVSPRESREIVMSPSASHSLPVQWYTRETAALPEAPHPMHHSPSPPTPPPLPPPCTSRTNYAPMPSYSSSSHPVTAASPAQPIAEATALRDWPDLSSHHPRPPTSHEDTTARESQNAMLARMEVSAAGAAPRSARSALMPPVLQATLPYQEQQHGQHAVVAASAVEATHASASSAIPNSATTPTAQTARTPEVTTVAAPPLLLRNDTAAAQPSVQSIPAVPVLSELERYIDQLWRQAQLGEARVESTLRVGQPMLPCPHTQSLPNPLVPTLSQPAAVHTVIAPTALSADAPTSAMPSHLPPPPPPGAPAAASAEPVAQPVHEPSSARAQALAQLRRDIANEAATMAHEAQRWHMYLQSSSNDQFQQTSSLPQTHFSVV